jgi:catechol 2,3-dioxygenase-like lactoylglutathione lyase family enzyme
VITSAHVTVFAQDADAARAFFRDVLELPCVDVGGGWLTFALPPTEVAFHPGAGWDQTEGHHLLFLMCDDIERTIADLEGKDVDFIEPITDEEWGRVTRFKVPGAGVMGLYQRSYAGPLD